MNCLQTHNCMVCSRLLGKGGGTATSCGLYLSLTSNSSHFGRCVKIGDNMVALLPGAAFFRCEQQQHPVCCSKVLQTSLSIFFFFLIPEEFLIFAVKMSSSGSRYLHILQVTPRLSTSLLILQILPRPSRFLHVLQVPPCLYVPLLPFMSLSILQIPPRPSRFLHVPSRSSIPLYISRRSPVFSMSLHVPQHYLLPSTSLVILLALPCPSKFLHIPLHPSSSSRSFHVPPGSSMSSRFLYGSMSLYVPLCPSSSSTSFRIHPGSSTLLHVPPRSSTFLYCSSMSLNILHFPLHPSPSSRSVHVSPGSSTSCMCFCVPLCPSIVEEHQSCVVLTARDRPGTREDIAVGMRERRGNFKKKTH